MLSQGLEKVDGRRQLIGHTCVELHELLNKGLWFGVVSITMVEKNNFVGNADGGKIYCAWHWLH